MVTRTPALSFEAVQEAEPGERLCALFQDRWPAYRRWMARAAPLSPGAGVDALRTYMPELVPTFERLLALVEGGDEEARFLSLYCPPRLVRACSQVVLDTDDGPVLLRTYDHAPHLFDGILLSSRWCQTPTLAVTDCLWGALDGINGHGLAVALAFGGRNAAGPGFAAPLLVRYVLETCATTAEATRALRRLPVHMPYTFTLADPGGDFLTVYLAPDRPAETRGLRASTNHLNESDWPEYARFSGSVERLSCLTDLLDRDAGFDEHLRCFLEPPIWRTGYAQGSGTLYAAEYRPCARSLSLHWPGRTERFALSTFADRSFAVLLPRPDHSESA